LVGVFAERGADGPTIRGRSARHPVKGVVRRGGRVVGRGGDGPSCPVPVFDERLDDAVAAGVSKKGVADGPAIRGRIARYTKEAVGLRDTGVGRGDDGPRCPVPMLGERVGDVGVVPIPADGPAIRRRRARYPIESVGLRGTCVGRGDEGPGCPVPVCGERVEDVVGGAIVADGPAIRRRSARYTKGYVFLRDVGQDDGPSCPVPMFDERVGGGEVGVILADGPAIRG